MSAGTIIQRPAKDVLAGDCVRIDGQWQTAWTVHQPGMPDDAVFILVDAGEREYDACALIETVEE